ACADELKALTNLSDIRSKPWVFVSFGPSQKKEPLGGGEPRQDRARGKKVLKTYRSFVPQDDNLIIKKAPRTSRS
ncbi:hypothetical protein ACTJKC_25385, partial [Pedobacter sp. 22226]|uniref:hypothetical protein n=1 Tax=Pedobacter sp. 22226 TaxID=3453894 RepID=UPI003F860416